MSVFSNKTRVEIVRLLSESEMATLSDIAGRLGRRNLGITLPGLFKHMGILEEAGIVRKMSGGVVLDEPDARKTVYLLEGKERVQKLLQSLEKNVAALLATGEAFHMTSKVARSVQEMGPKLASEETKRLETLLELCEASKIYSHLTEDEKKKLKLWKMMLTL